MKLEAPSLDWMAVLPEVVLATTAIVVLLTALIPARISRWLAPLLAAGGFIASGFIAWSEFGTSRIGEWAGQVDADPLANLVRILVAIAGALTVAFAASTRANDGRDPEFYALLAAAGAGMGMFGASGSLVTLFVGLELFSIALYIMCALDAERSTSLESGLKYLIIGGVSSAVLLYGIAMMYGATGEFGLREIGATNLADGRELMFGLGAAMVIAGMAFKATAAPVHWWAPDVYDGAPTSVTAFMATATKAAALLAFARVLVVSMDGLAESWEPLLAAIAVTSIVVGNLGALAQVRLKRMLAYSGIAQAGYMTLGLVAWTSSGIAALSFALVVYVVMTMGAFALVLMREQAIGHAVTYDDLRGIGWTETVGVGWLSALPGIGMVILMLSLSGIPPTAGFFSKFLLFDAAVRDDWSWLAIVGVVGSLVSLGYYLRVPVAMYFQSPLDTAVEPADDNEDGRPKRGAFVLAGIGVLAAIAVIVIAVKPTPIIDDACSVRKTLVIEHGADVRCVTSESESESTGP
jgi:NADH-quinone oxidoreductase subunit N